MYILCTKNCVHGWSPNFSVAAVVAATSATAFGVDSLLFHTYAALATWLVLLGLVIYTYGVIVADNTLYCFS